MTNDAQKEFLNKAKKEIDDKIKTETKNLEKLNKETSELERGIKGYEDYYNNLIHFIRESMQDFTLNEEDLPNYFKSNINEVYQNYVQIKQDTYDETKKLKKYLEHTKKESNSNKRTLKFYKSQYLDSDFFEECLPLIDIYEKKIEAYETHQKQTLKIIEQLEKIAKKLEQWK